MRADRTGQLAEAGHAAPGRRGDPPRRRDRPGATGGRRPERTVRRCGKVAHAQRQPTPVHVVHLRLHRGPQGRADPRPHPVRPDQVAVRCRRPDRPRSHPAVLDAGLRRVLPGNLRNAVHRWQSPAHTPRVASGRARSPGPAGLHGGRADLHALRGSAVARRVRGPPGQVPLAAARGGHRGRAAGVHRQHPALVRRPARRAPVQPLRADRDTRGQFPVPGRRPESLAPTARHRTPGGRRRSAGGGRPGRPGPDRPQRRAADRRDHDHPLLPRRTRARRHPLRRTPRRGPVLPQWRPGLLRSRGTAALRGPRRPADQTQRTPARTRLRRGGPAAPSGGGQRRRHT